MNYEQRDSQAEIEQHCLIRKSAGVCKQVTGGQLALIYFTMLLCEIPVTL